MKYIFFIGLAIFEQVLMLIITKEIIHLQYEYISIRYATFKFADKEEKFCGLNILIKLFFPLIYMIILSGIFYNINRQELVNDIYLVTIFYYILRWLNIIFILNRKELHDWKSEIIISIIGIIINIIIYDTFITKTTQIFISIDELRDGIWIGIITFFFVVLRDFVYTHAHTNALKSEQRKENYILKKYEYYKNKYDYIINEDNKQIENIVYGIMIYESYNRPAFWRIFEQLKCVITGEATLGIMQVKSRVPISDKTSVKKGYKIIKDEYNKKASKEYYDEYEQLRDVISVYNLGSSYTDEILYIIEVINMNDSIAK